MFRARTRPKDFYIWFAPPVPVGDPDRISGVGFCPLPAHRGRPVRTRGRLAPREPPTEPAVGSPLHRNPPSSPSPPPRNPTVAVAVGTTVPTDHPGPTRLGFVPPAVTPDPCESISAGTERKRGTAGSRPDDGRTRRVPVIVESPSVPVGHRPIERASACRPIASHGRRCLPGDASSRSVGFCPKGGPPPV